MTKQYIQIAHRLRLSRSQADGGDVVSERPYTQRKRTANGRWEYVYSDEGDGAEPTLIEFLDCDTVDVDSLLRAGLIREYIPPKRKRTKRQKPEVDNGETGS